MVKAVVRSHEVAKLAGVSRSAVSRAFTAGTYIAPETRRRILAAAEQLGYSPNAIARSLITSRTGIVGVVTATLDNPAYAASLDSICFELQERGVASLVLTATGLDETDRLVSKLLTYQVDGLILTAASLSSTVAAQCTRAGKPLVLMTRYTDVNHVMSVVSDNVQGGRNIADLLVDAGHARIAMISGLEATSDGRDRARGFRERLRELGHPDIVEPGFYSHQGATEAARRLLSSSVCPDALFCSNDVMAAAAFDVVRVEFGLRVPEDVAIVGYDNSSIAEWPAYSLTSVDQNIPEMARLAVAMLLDGGSIHRPSCRLTVPSTLVIRRSTR